MTTLQQRRLQYRRPRVRFPMWRLQWRREARRGLAGLPIAEGGDESVYREREARILQSAALNPPPAARASTEVTSHSWRD
jgi:hypothetical protein